MSDTGPIGSDKPTETAPGSGDLEKMVAIWADVFHLETIGADDEFLALGGDSILAAILLGEVQEVFGVEIPLIDFHEARTPANLVDVVSRARAAGGSEPAPGLVSAPEAQYEPFPLTEVQEVYWAGRMGDFQLGNVSTHGYTEIDCTDLDLPRLEAAWRKLVDRHPMLRAVLLPDGEQKVLEQVPPYRIEIVDLRGRSTDETERELKAIREQMSHAVHPSDRWPLFEIRASLIDDRRTRLHMSLDALIMDAWSRRAVLFPEWGQLYENPDCTLPPLELTFRDYVLAERAVRDAEHARASEYWEDRLDDFPPAPELPLAANPDSIEKPMFLRRTAYVEPDTWGSVRKRAARSGITATAVLATAFAEVLKTWSHRPRFTLNLTTFNRRPLHPQVTAVLGDFTSISLLEIDASGRASFEARARELMGRLWEDLDHSAMSGIQVMRALAARQEGVPRALMPIVLTSAIARDGRGDAHDWLGKNVYGVAQTPQVWLDLHIFEEGGTLVIHWNEVEELFPPGLMQEACDAFVRRLHQLGREPESWEDPAGPEMVPRSQLEERARVNATSAPIPGGLLHTAFVEQAAKRPAQPAVITPGRVVTYEEVLSTSNRIARVLRERGARPNALVAVVTEKDWEQVPAVLGVLQAGAAYLPIDSTTPTERLHHLLKHARVDLVVTQGCVDPVLEWPADVQRITVNERQLDGVSDDPLDSVQSPEDLAYVIYTSGSTGLPKGVMIDHRAALNTIHAVNRRFEVLPEDRVFAISALSFDLSVYDIFGTLAAGGTIVMPEVSGLRDPVHWAEMIEREKVTIWDSVPALMELLVETASGRSGPSLHSLRLALLSGDWIPLTLPDRVRALTDARVIGMGGATEASIWSIFYPVKQVDSGWKSIPYGRPLDNQTFHVMDEALRPRPIWVPGQLYIGGAGVAKGYWLDEARTAESFVRHPESGERIYHTGDLGRYLPGGDIEFLGREDSQVKVQGFRIELAEVEHALQQHPSVRACVVQLGGDPRGKRFLIGYVVPDSVAAPEVEGLRDFLKNKLPDYMVPTQFVTLPELPLTANGKVDRKALPSPTEVEARPQATVSAGTDVDRLSAVVRRIMEIETLDPAANLIHLGATSIDMIRIANLLERELEFRPSMDTFYADPTVNGLAALYAKQTPRAEPPPPAATAVQVATPAVAVPGTTAVPAKPFIDDPVEREAFKKTQPGLRRDVERRPSVGLEPSEFERRPYLDRRSVRRFGLKPIPLERMGELLSCLRQVDDGGRPKYRYGSAGALYPVQTYLYVKPGRVQGLGGGTYYHHPVEHRLVSLSPKVEIEPSVYDRMINRPIFEESAFAIFLIAELDAITPMYADRALHLSTIEAGLMTQLLEEIGPPLGLGLCQIGNLEFDMIRHFFALRDSHVLLHSLLGGPIEAGAEDEDESARLLRRVQELSPDEARALLDAHREGEGS